MQTLREEIEEKMPKTVDRANNGSKVAAIRLFCLECMGGRRQDAIHCTTTECWLHAHRGSTWVSAARLRKTR